MKKTKLTTLALTTLVLLTACGETPLEKLQNDKVEPSIDRPFWDKEVNAQTDLWKEALTYCRANPKKINCMSVRRAWGHYNQTKIMNAGSTKPVKYAANPDDIIHSPYSKR